MLHHKRGYFIEDLLVKKPLHLGLDDKQRAISQKLAINVRYTFTVSMRHD